jgi:hypothetical protein
LRKAGDQQHLLAMTDSVEGDLSCLGLGVQGSATPAGDLRSEGVGRAESCEARQAPGCPQHREATGPIAADGFGAAQIDIRR